MSPASPAHAAADALLAQHGAVFGADLPTYSGHVHRVIGLVEGQTPVPDDLAAPLGLAAFFHDAGIWFDDTWDYLPPSIARAVAALGPDSPHVELVTAMIDEHHRVRHARHPHPLVEAMRRADLTDVSGGLVPSPGVSRAAFKALAQRYPSRGFRPMLARAFVRGLRQDPRRPAPMVKL